MKFKSYRQFEGYYDPPEEEPWFIETYESLVQEFESKLAKEISNFNPESWWESMIELDKEAEFDMDAEALVSTWYSELYAGEYNPEIDDNETTPEYERVRKEVAATLPKNKSMYDREMRNKLNVALVKNAIEKHWPEWKAFYQKWIDFIDSKRGFLAGKKFGL
jgi:hypothetical protein